MAILFENNRKRVLDALAALAALGDGYWTRQDIAKQLGKAQLNPFDKEAIEQMVADGTIEGLMVPTANPYIMKQVVRIPVKEGSK